MHQVKGHVTRIDNWLSWAKTLKLVRMNRAEKFRKCFVLCLQVFSSFHEEMEERRKDEARRQSEGNDKLASIAHAKLFRL